MEIFIGCAGWNIGREMALAFPAEGTHLERYAARLNAVEINSSFYRPHRRATYERWAKSTPEQFRFAVKLPKQITHIARLAGAESLIEQFLAEVAGLGSKLGPILVQLPPSLRYEVSTADMFFAAAAAARRTRLCASHGMLSWFTAGAETLLKTHAVERVAADPAIVAATAVPGGHGHDVYYRWHGSPRMYYSAYNEQSGSANLATRLLARLRNRCRDVWCIFDNTPQARPCPTRCSWPRSCVNDDLT